MSTIIDETYAFQLAFLNVVDRFREEKFMRDGELTHSELARRAFSNVSDPIGKWRKTRHEGRVLTIGEAHMLARALGEDTSYLVHLAQNEMLAANKAVTPKEKTTSLADEASKKMRKKAS